MPRESDAQECLTEAIYERNHVQVGPEQFADVTPQNLFYEDGDAWQETLAVAAACLRGKGYTVGDPAIAKATALLSKPLLHSQAYLVSLITG